MQADFSISRIVISGITAIAAASLFVSCAENGTETSAATESLFNGQDLTGWKGNPDNWTVQDGVIVGTTNSENPLPYNQFLIYEGEDVTDFELSVELKLTSEGNNSGIQYRAQIRDDIGDFVVSGYQCDMHAAVWANGMLYDEKERGILCKRGQKVVIPKDGGARVVGDLGQEPEFDTSEWNKYTVIARGNHLIHKINDTVTAEIYDHEKDERDLSGKIAFQIHRGPEMKIEIRNIQLKRLPEAELVLPKDTPIPGDAPLANPPKKPKGKSGTKAGGGKSKAK